MFLVSTDHSWAIKEARSHEDYSCTLLCMLAYMHGTCWAGVDLENGGPQLEPAYSRSSAPKFAKCWIRVMRAAHSHGHSEHSGGGELRLGSFQ